MCARSWLWSAENTGKTFFTYQRMKFINLYIHSFIYFKTIVDYIILFIGNLNSNVVIENTILLTKMKSDDECIIHYICIKFVKLNFDILTLIF